MSFWRSEFSPEEITYVLDKLREHRKLSPDGKVSLSGAGTVDAWIAFLISASGFEVRTDTLRTKIVRGALLSSNLSEDFSEEDFRRVAYQLRNIYANEEVKVYKVAFPIWNKPDFLNGRKRIDDVTVNLSPSQKTKFFKRISQERDRQRTSRNFELFFTDARLSDLRRCSICIAHVRANSPADANERASEAIYEILGLTNLAKDSGKYWRLSSRVSGKLPVSEVLIGPHTTTHFEDGTLTHDGFWYENWVGGPNFSALNFEKKRAWASRYDQLSKGVSQSLWRDRCKTAVARYFKAFSNPDLKESFLDGWRLFENVTGSRYEKIETQINRASNVFEDNIEYRIIGKHLAHRRNLISHGHPIKTDDDETLAFQMLQFVVPFLEYFILVGFSFRSPEEFWEFLDLPHSQEERISEQNTLRRRLSLLDKAAQFRGESDGD